MMPRMLSPAALLCLLLAIRGSPLCHAWSVVRSAASALSARSSVVRFSRRDIATTTEDVPSPRSLAGRHDEGRHGRAPRGRRWTHDASSFSSSTALSMAAADESTIGDSDQAALGLCGTVAALIVLYSEFTLKTTGCGLPAGPLGLLGAAEGVSYLFVVALAAFSLYTKVKTGTGLPPGPGGILGAAEGLSFLAIATGLVVLGFQISDYGYIPNAVPVEGGMCS